MSAHYVCTLSCRLPLPLRLRRRRRCPQRRGVMPVFGLLYEKPLRYGRGVFAFFNASGTAAWQSAMASASAASSGLGGVLSLSMLITILSTCGFWALPYAVTACFTCRGV